MTGPRVVAHEPDHPAPHTARHPTVLVVAEPEHHDAARTWLATQTETSATLDDPAVSSHSSGGDFPGGDSHGEVTGVVPFDPAWVTLPATLLESLWLTAVAADVPWAVAGWATPSSSAAGPDGTLRPPAPDTPLPLLVRTSAEPHPRVLGRAVGHLQPPDAPDAVDTPSAHASPVPWTGRATGPWCVTPHLAPGAVVHHPTVDAASALAHLPAVDGPPTVLFLLPFLALGGAEHLLFDLLEGITPYRCLVVTLEPHQQHLGDTVERCRRLTPHVYTLGDWLPREAHDGVLRHLLRRYRVETLVSWNGTVAFYDRAAQWRREFPNLRILHQLYNHEGAWIDRCGPALGRALDGHLAVNRRIASALVERGMPEERIAVVHHGVAVPELPAPEERRNRQRQAREAMGLPVDALVVGTFVRLHRQKRPLDILTLARRLTGHEPSIVFLLAGGGPLDGAVDDDLARSPIPNLLRLPFQRDVGPLYDAVDLCLSTSSYEGLPVFLLDALARSIPCVTTAVGEIPELLANGGGVLVDTPGDLDALQAGILQLTDPDLRHTEGLRGRHTVEQHFDLETYRQRYLDQLFPTQPLLTHSESPTTDSGASEQGLQHGAQSTTPAPNSESPKTDHGSRGGQGLEHGAQSPTSAPYSESPTTDHGSRGGQGLQHGAQSPTSNTNSESPRTDSGARDGQGLEHGAQRLDKTTATTRAPRAEDLARPTPNTEKLDNSSLTKISVVIPSYNHAPFIEEAVSSVLDNDLDLELVIVDDGSQDDSLERLQAIDDPRLHLVSQDNQGAHAALARGVDLSQGEIVSILNSDDAYHPERLPKILQAFQDDPDLALVTSWLEIIDGQSQPLGVKKAWHTLPPWPQPHPGPSLSDTGDPLLALLDTNYISTTSNVAFRRRHYVDHGLGFAPLRYTHDWDFILSLCRHGRLQVLDEPLVRYRVHDSNTIREGRDDAQGAMRFEILWVVARHAPWILEQAAGADRDRQDLEHRAWRSMPRFGRDDVLTQLLALSGRPGYDRLLDPEHPLRRHAVEILNTP